MKLEFEYYFSEISLRSYVLINLKNASSHNKITIKEETPRSNSTMSPIEKVSRWLPATQPRAPAINDKQKASLLCQLNNIDTDPQPLYSNVPSPKERKSLTGSSSLNTEAEDSVQSKLERKTNLMTELFGDSKVILEVKDVYECPRLKTIEDLS